MKIIKKGSFFSSCYLLNDPEDVASRIYSKDNLPNFTGITDEDKSHINKARFNLFALLMPIHDRETALNEFMDVAREWGKQSAAILQESELMKFKYEYQEIKKNEDYIY